MKANERPIDYVRPQDQYEEFERAIKDYFYYQVTTINKHLYMVKTNPEKMWDLYLSNLPEEGRHVYNCRYCRHFIERFGGLVTVDDNGDVTSALWNADVPTYFVNAVVALQNYVERDTYPVEDIFISDARVLGTPKTGIWTHLNVELPKEMVNNSRVKNAYQLMAEKREDRLTLLRALQEYPLNIAEQAVALLQTEAMYRSDRVLGVAEWFVKVHKILENKRGYQKTNLIWKIVAEAPTGYCHIKSSMIGSLLDDIKAGYSTRVIMARFEEKMNPQNYMRSQSAPTAAAIEQAEKLVEKLGIADSLRRRYARFEEVSNACFWTPRGPLYNFLKKTEQKSTGVFSHLTPKDAAPSNDISLDLPTTTMTWAKFSKTILPTADKLEVKVDNPNRFMALVTEAVPGSEPILQWDNPFSWYYHGGIDGEIKRRVEAAGGMYENCALRCSLIWNNYTDLDLHCFTPSKQHIYWQVRRREIGGGMLDVDANGCDKSTDTPVENIRWAHNALNGRYKFVVHCYRDNNYGDNPYKVELKIGGKIYSVSGDLRRTGDSDTVFEFDYYNGVVSNLRTGQNVTEAASSASEVWGLAANSFVKVNGILKSPNVWGKEADDHTFFILDGCKDTSEGKGRGFFNEILKPELREIRKTLELYSANTPIEEVEFSDACGVGFTKDSEWNLTLKVTSGGNTRLVKIDRFD